MQSDRPMDRLLCGDVGFSKTEVALRAVMKCILAGKQAAILVPTTVLARQHYLTAMQRFQGHPITIELLTRYKTGSEQTALLKSWRRARSIWLSARTSCSTKDQVQGSPVCSSWTRNSGSASGTKGNAQRK